MDDRRPQANAEDALTPTQPALWTSEEALRWGQALSQLSSAGEQADRLILAIYEFRRDITDNPNIAIDQHRIEAISSAIRSPLSEVLNERGLSDEVLGEILFADPPSAAYLTAVNSLPAGRTELGAELIALTARQNQLQREQQFLLTLPRAERDALWARDNFRVYGTQNFAARNRVAALIAVATSSLNMGDARIIEDNTRVIRSEDSRADRQLLSQARQVANAEVEDILRLRQASSTTRLETPSRRFESEATGTVTVAPTDADLLADTLFAHQELMQALDSQPPVASSSNLQGSSSVAQGTTIPLAAQLRLDVNRAIEDLRERRAAFIRDNNEEYQNWERAQADNAFIVTMTPEQLQRTTAFSSHLKSMDASDSELVQFQQRINRAALTREDRSLRRLEEEIADYRNRLSAQEYRLPLHVNRTSIFPQILNARELLRNAQTRIQTENVEACSDIQDSREDPTYADRIVRERRSRMENVRRELEEIDRLIRASENYSSLIRYSRTQYEEIEEFLQNVQREYAVGSSQTQQSPTAESVAPDPANSSRVHARLERRLTALRSARSSVFEANLTTREDTEQLFRDPNSVSRLNARRRAAVVDASDIVLELNEVISNAETYQRSLTSPGGLERATQFLDNLDQPERRANERQSATDRTPAAAPANRATTQTPLVNEFGRLGSMATGGEQSRRAGAAPQQGASTSAADNEVTHIVADIDRAIEGLEEISNRMRSEGGQYVASPQVSEDFRILQRYRRRLTRRTTDERNRERYITEIRGILQQLADRDYRSAAAYGIPEILDEVDRANETLRGVSAELGALSGRWDEYRRATKDRFTLDRYQTQLADFARPVSPEELGGIQNFLREVSDREYVDIALGISETSTQREMSLERIRRFQLATLRDNYLSALEERKEPMEQLLRLLKADERSLVMDLYRRNPSAPGAGMTREEVQRYIDNNENWLRRINGILNGAPQGQDTLRGILRELRGVPFRQQTAMEVQSVQQALARLKDLRRRLPEYADELPGYEQSPSAGPLPTTLERLETEAARVAAGLAQLNAQARTTERESANVRAVEDQSSGTRTSEQQPPEYSNVVSQHDRQSVPEPVQTVSGASRANQPDPPAQTTAANEVYDSELFEIADYLGNFDRESTAEPAPSADNQARQPETSHDNIHSAESETTPPVLLDNTAPRTQSPEEEELIRQEGILRARVEAADRIFRRVQDQSWGTFSRDINRVRLNELRDRDNGYISEIQRFLAGPASLESTEASAFIVELQEHEITDQQLIERAEFALSRIQPRDIAVPAPPGYGTSEAPQGEAEHDGRQRQGHDQGQEQELNAEQAQVNQPPVPQPPVRNRNSAFGRSRLGGAAHFVNKRLWQLAHRHTHFVFTPSLPTGPFAELYAAHAKKLGSKVAGIDSVLFEKRTPLTDLFASYVEKWDSKLAGANTVLHDKKAPFLPEFSGPAASAVSLPTSLKTEEAMPINVKLSDVAPKYRNGVPVLYFAGEDIAYISAVIPERFVERNTKSEKPVKVMIKVENCTRDYELTPQQIQAALGSSESISLVRRKTMKKDANSPKANSNSEDGKDREMDKGAKRRSR